MCLRTRVCHVPFKRLATSSCRLRQELRSGWLTREASVAAVRAGFWRGILYRRGPAWAPPPPSKENKRRDIRALFPFCLCLILLAPSPATSDLRGLRTPLRLRQQGNQISQHRGPPWVGGVTMVKSRNRDWRVAGGRDEWRRRVEEREIKRQREGGG